MVRARLRRVDAMAREGASLAQIASALNVSEMVLIALAERHLTGRYKHGYSGALDHAAAALGVSREAMMARILTASFEG
jgi:hypothetical protein